MHFPTIQCATCLISLCGLTQSTAPAPPEILRIAGTGDKVSGVDGEATHTGVGGPFGVAVGPDGHLYICETTGHVVRRLNRKTGSLTTVTGTLNRGGYSGDGGPAHKARLNEPYEVRFDKAGNMFFVEMKNHIVRRVDATTGVITTVAGTGKPGFSGDGGAANKAQLHRPHSIALDESGGLYVCDIRNHRVRKVDLESGIITTFAGTGAKKRTRDGARLEGTPLNGPRALDYRSGNLLLALREGNAVYRIDLKTRTFHHLAGTGKKGYSGDGGPAKLATLSGPKGVSVAANGDIYLADTESHTIRVIRKANGHIETVVGTGKKGAGADGDPLKCEMDRPHGVFVDKQGNVFIGDSSNHRVLMLKGRKP